MDGSSSIIIRANDTDVLVIAISAMSLLQALGLKSMWIAFGQGATLRWIPIHDVVSAIGPERASGILFFHAFTGCDIVSGFRGKGKKTAWQTWNICDDVSETFTKLSQQPTEVTELDLQQLEKFVVMVYDRSSAVTSVDEARLDLFARKQRPYNSIPPTQAALREHTKHAAYQAGIVWGQTTISLPEIDSPVNWGWTKTDGKWRIVWSTLPPVADSCQELTKCACKKGCQGRCKCYKSGLPCTALCSCGCDSGN
jgi:hypothetical protein